MKGPGIAHSQLAALILQEKQNKNSKFKEYLNTFPKDLSNFPVFFSDEEMEYLNGSPFKQKILRKKRELERDYQEICKAIPSF